MHVTTNPVLPGFNPDPSCVRVDGVYYVVTSSFEYLPALPVHRSVDLLTWEHIGNVATTEPQAGLSDIRSGFGVWAPTIRHHAGRFHVIVSIAGSPRGCVVFTAEDAAGPWSDGTTIDGIDGIDPDVAWDGDGTAFVTWSGLRMDDERGWSHDGILQARVDLERGSLLEEPRSLWSGTGLTAPEAPHVFERDGSWWLVIAEGGTGRGHAVSVARSGRIDGPFEGCPTNPVLTASGSDRPVVSTGHGDFLTAPDGSDVLLLLGTRTLGGTFSPIGREAFLTTVDWGSGWPVPQPVEARPAVADVHERFAFDHSADLTDPGWVSVARPPTDIGVVARGALEIRGRGRTLESGRPDFIGRRQRHLRSMADVVLDVSAGSGGIGLRFDEHSFIEVIAEPTGPHGARVVTRARTASIEQCWETTLDDATQVALAIETDLPEADAPALRADTIRVLAGTGGRETDPESRGLQTVAEFDGRAWSVEVAAPFTGRIVGVLAAEGVLRVLRFDYRGHGGT